MLNNATGFKHIYIATGYADLRKSIDGLAMLISTEFKLNPYDEGSIFLFCGKRNDRIKALVFEGDGFLLMYKRLADGKYKWPRSGEDVRNITEQQYKELIAEDNRKFNVITIPADSKHKIKEELAKIGITEGFVYPEIEHLSNSLLNGY